MKFYSRHLSFILVYLCLLVMPNHVSGQVEALFTQHANHMLILNPAFAGSRNSLAVDLFSRQQWLGMENAPATYYIGIHSPVNRSRVSLGASLMSDHAGPLVSNHFSVVYSYLTRLSPRLFLSKGLSGGIDNHWLSVHQLDIVDNLDPVFQRGIENSFHPVIGAGFVLFSPEYFVGVSSPRVLSTRAYYGLNRTATFRMARSLNFTAGYRFEVLPAVSFRLSGFARVAEDNFNDYYLSGISVINEVLKLGGTMRFNKSVSMIIGVQLNENWGITYSYDFPLQGLQPHSFSGQELTISLDSFRFFRRNRDRQFLKREVQEEDPLIRSIRHF